MEADGIGLDRRITLIHDHLAADECESPQRRHGLDQAVASKHRGERLTESIARLGKQEQWDRLRRQQSSVDDQRLCCGVEIGSFLDSEREGLCHGQPVMIFGWCMARVVE
jgi:hypothetical protein